MLPLYLRFNREDAKHQYLEGQKKYLEGIEPLPFDDDEKRILQRVLTRVNEKRTSLNEFSEAVGTQGIGMEGWLKVEAVCALRDLGTMEVHNRGPDIDIQINKKVKKSIELKASNLSSLSYAKNWRKKYSYAVCLFMAKGCDVAKECEKANKEGIEILLENIDPDWVLGLLKV